MNDALGWMLDLVESVDPIIRTLVAGIGMLLETSVLVGLVVPGDSIVIVASTAVDGVVEYLALFCAAVAGALSGESIGFALGHHFGPRIRHSRLGRRIGERNWVRAEIFLARRGGVAVFISRFIPGLHSLVPLTVGMSGMRYSRFMKWTVPACLLWALAYVSAGTFAAGTYRELSSKLHYAGYIFVGIIVAFFVLVFIAKKLAEKREARHMEDTATTVSDGADTDGPEHGSGPSTHQDVV